jgi:hypothetical protein
MPRKPPLCPDEDLNLFDYENYSPRRLPRPTPSHVSIEVTDDWPAEVPISLREIEVTETHLERALAELLGPLP